MNILIVDDEVSALRDLARTLKKTVQDADIKQADRAETALTLCREQEFDVAFLDIRMPGKDGVGALRDILAADPEAKVVMLTTSGTEEDIYRSLELGAKGYVMKDGDTGEIMEAIRTVAAGGRFVPEDIQVVYERRAAAPEMTEREIETLRLAAVGRTNREIAEALGLSEVTVKVRLTGIFAKLGARDRVDAVNRAVARGLVPPRA